MTYLIAGIILFAGMLFYFRLANHFNIIDKPNERSSHNYITIRGGGVIFWLAGIGYACSLLSPPFTLLLFALGLTLICGVSFLDDISSLPNKIRILFHFLAISMVFYGLGLYTILPWQLIVVAYILFIGIMNAYNFMDGINGITGLYSLVILAALQYINYQLIPFTDPDFINYAGLACTVFLFFNFRKRAKCFAGDVGSMGISFWIVTLLLQLMLKSDSFIWILFLAVYGVDTVATILHRLYLRQNIFQAHRLHFYQILSNEHKISHLKVSTAYAFVQILICGITVYVFEHHSALSWITGILTVVLLSLIYLFKFRRKT